MNFQDINTGRTTWSMHVARTHRQADQGREVDEQLLIPAVDVDSPTLTARSELTRTCVCRRHFVSVLTKTTQAPTTCSPPRRTAYHRQHNGWLITDVGGIGAVVGAK